MRTSLEKAKEYLSSHGHIEGIVDANHALIELLDTHAAEAEEEQRQMCADAVIQEMGGKDYAGYLLATRLNNACLNATGEK